MFKVVDIRSREVLAEDVTARATVDVLRVNESERIRLRESLAVAEARYNKDNADAAVKSADDAANQ